MYTQKGSMTIAATMATLGVAFLAFALAGCGVTANHDKACFYTEKGIQAEADQQAGIIRTAKEDTRRPASFLKYREEQNKEETSRAKIRSFWGTLSPQEN